MNAKPLESGLNEERICQQDKEKDNTLMWDSFYMTVRTAESNLFGSPLQSVTIETH